MAIFSSLSLDLTQNKIYTLSDGTKSILGKLNEPITIRFFYSEEVGRNYPAIQSYYNRILGLLKKYQNISHKQIKLEIINPQQFSKEEDQAVAFGIQPVPTSDNGEKLYFGINLSNSTDELKTISFLDPSREAFVEYDLTHMIYQLANPKKPVIGLLNMVELEKNPFSQEENPFTILDKLKELYEVKNIDSNIKTIDKNIDVLVIIHPHGLSEDTQYAIDQYILSGGKAFIFVDPYLELSNGKYLSSSLDKLFKAWGIEFSENNVALDGDNFLRTADPRNSSGNETISKLNYIKLTKEMLNQQQITTSSLNNINIISGGEFKFNKKNSKLNFIPLFNTSSNSMIIDKSMILDSSKLISKFSSSKQQHVLAAYINGNAITAFPNYKQGQLNKSNSSINIVLVGDVDMLRDQFWLQKQNFFGQILMSQFADNGSFFVNTLDQLAGSSDLITLRSRSIADRPFKVVNNLRQKAEALFLTQEQALNEQLKNIEAKLNNLEQNNKSNNSTLIDEKLNIELENYKIQMLQTRAKLRDVKHQLNQEIDSLGSILKFIHIIILPVFVIILSLILPKRFKRN